MTDNDERRAPWSAPDAEPEPRGPDPMTGAELSESVFRWAATAGFIVFGIALLYVLGTEVAPWTACVAGIVLCAVPMARLWARHEDRLTDARIRRENNVGAAPYDPGPAPRARSLTIGPGNDAPHDSGDRYGPYGG